MAMTLHAIGDSTFLATILNSVAMIFTTEDIRTAAAIGALIGVLMQAFRGLLDTGPPTLRYGECLTAILLWLLLFHPTTEVTIEDAYTGEVRSVDHVPLGPAVSGAIISELGYGLTVLFETAFEIPTMTQHGYAGALETLTQVRRNLLSRLSIGKALDPSPTSDVATSVSTYVRDCTLTGVDLGVIDISTLLNTGGLPEAFRYDSEIYTTEIRDGSSPLLVTCTAAWPRLRHLIEDEALPLLERTLGLFMTGPGAKDPMGTIQSALDALTQGQQQAADFVLTATLVPLFEQGVLGRHQDSLKATQAAMVETAISQRNTQWAAEQTLFSRMVRPMLTWIEGFSYAVTPIMAFTLLLGARGIRMCGQYALMLIWIQFWMPILAIGNLYITLATQGGFTALAKARFPLDSVSGLYQMDMELQNWLSVGGMLASATPAIALMLVYGGSVTATHFLGRMQGGDFIDEKIGSPSLVSTPALIGMESRHRHGPLSGLSLSGAERVLPTFSFAQDQGLSLSTTSSRRERTTASFMESLRVHGSRTHGMTEEGSHTDQLTQRMASEASATDRFIEATGQDLAQRYRESGLSGHDFSTLLGGALTGRWRGENDKTSPSEATVVGLQGELQDRFHMGEGRAREIASDLSQKISTDHGFQMALAQSVATDASEGHRTITALGLRSEAVGELGRSAQSVHEAEAAYQSTVQGSHRHGTEVRIGALEAGQRIMEQPQTLKALNQALDSVGLRGDAERLGGEWSSRGLIGDAAQSYAAAGLALLTGHAHPVFRALGEEESVLAQTLGRTVLGEAFNAPYITDDLAPSRQGKAIQSPESSGQLEAHVMSGMPANPLDQGSSIINQSVERLHQSESRVGMGEQKITGVRDNAFSALKGHQETAEMQLQKDRQELLSPSLDAAAANASPSEAIDGISGAFLRASYTRLKVLAEGGLEAFGQIFEEAQEKGDSPTQTLKLLFERSPSIIEGEVFRWIDEASEQVKDALTPAQSQYYKAALLESFAGFPVTGDYQEAMGDLGAARKALDEESGSKGAVIATLLRKMAAGNRSDLLGLMRSYNGRH